MWQETHAITKVQFSVIASASTSVVTSENTRRTAEVLIIARTDRGQAVVESTKAGYRGRSVLGSWLAIWGLWFGSQEFALRAKA